MKKLMPAITILCLIAFISCKNNGTGPEETSTYNVSVSLTPSDGGSVSPDTDQTLEEGETAKIEAIANEEYVFAGWTGDIESSDNPFSLTVDQDYSITANFELKSYELTVNKEGEGEVSEKLVKQQAKKYDHGAVVELMADPAKGYKFAEWSGDVSGVDNPVQVTVDNPMEVTAVFEKKSYNLSVTTIGEGTIAKDPDQVEYLYGDTVRVTTTPASGWSFVEWKGDISATDDTLAIRIDTTKEVTAVFENPFSGGDGTEANPYRIATIEDLQNINSMSSNGLYFTQTNDIDATESVDWNRGKGFAPIVLRGLYDGQGHTISGLTIDRNENHVGLFSQVSEYAEVRNVRLENVDIRGESRGIGGLAGIVKQYGTIYNSSATGKVQCTDSRCGGLVGDNYGDIENSFADVKVTSIEDYVGGLVGLNWGKIEHSYASGSVTGIYYVGGLVGRITNNNDTYSSQIYRSYARGQVTGKDRIGGLVGNNSPNSHITYSFAAGEVLPSTSGTTTMGGLIGSYNSTDTVVSYCYWDTESTDQAEGAGGSGSLSAHNYGLTTSEMTGDNAKINMSALDFVSIWKVIEGDYPALFWE